MSLDYQDIDDELFLRNSYWTQPTYSNAHYICSQERINGTTTDKRMELEKSILQSARNSLTLLSKTEDVGKATAEELLRQRRMLMANEERLDTISGFIRTNQKYLRTIGSAFGAMKNYLSRKCAKETSPNESLSNETSLSPIDRKKQLHELLHEDKHILKDEIPLGHSSSDASPANESTNVQDVVDKNLDKMLFSVNTLKALSVNMGSELDTHNTILDNVLYKTESVQFAIQQQDKEINKILK